MSSSASSGSSSRTDRQPAKRAFAEEFQDASEIFQDGADERSPKFAVLPTGENANRVLAMGTLTEAQDVSKSANEYWQARVVDPTGAFFVYAGQYQSDAMAVLRELETPEYVAVVGKPRTWETDDGEVRTSLTPESITVVEQGTRDTWVVETAEQTITRINAMEAGEGEAGEQAQDAYPEADMSEYEASIKEALAQVAGIEIESDEEDEEGDESDQEAEAE